MAPKKSVKRNLPEEPKPKKKRKVIKDNKTYSNIEPKPSSRNSNKTITEVELVIEKCSSIERKVKLLAELGKINEGFARTLVNYFEDEITIPFMARYRKKEIYHATPEQLRGLKETLDSICMLIAKSKTIMRALIKANKFSAHLEEAVNAARSIEELEYIYEPYKDKKSNKLEDAKSLGLQEIANAIFFGNEKICVDSAINTKVKQGKNKEEVEAALYVILEHMISTNAELLAQIRILKSCEKIMLTSSKVSKNKVQMADASKFQLYFNFSKLLSDIKPHQILAINRGTSKKVLSSEIILPHSLKENLHTKARNIFLSKGFCYEERTTTFDKAFNNAFRHKIAPMIKRTIRTELNKLAEKASLEVFANNLKWLLLSPPIRGITVLAIDPGFHHGCKLAVVSPSGCPLSTEVLNLTTQKCNPAIQNRLTQIIVNFSVNVIAIGNGKGCREVEEFISDIIKKKLVHPLDISYTIVNEQGVSIYSCSKEAAEEFPNVDPNLISAISLGRRLLDPLSELVKVEPKHLGVGMYQHDITPKKLDDTLCEVVSECVSSVGVDINTASKRLLRNVAGLNDKKVELIIARRMNNGPFMNREELKSLKSIGPKTFQQCAGFIKIIPETIKTERLPRKSRNQFQPLDQTDIHPEFYDIAYKITEKCCVNTQDLGTDKFIDDVKRWMLNTDLQQEAQVLEISYENLQIILDSFTTKLGSDFRLQLCKPLFQKSIKTIKSLTFGQGLTGQITNVTHFGAFVDVGIERQALIPNKYMHDYELKLGNLVKTKVIDIDMDMKKVTLDLLDII